MTGGADGPYGADGADGTHDSAAEADGLNWIRATDDPSPDAACIEMAEGPDGLIHLRQSDDPSKVVTTTRTKWHAFVLGVRNNEFDHFVQPETESPQR